MMYASQVAQLASENSGGEVLTRTVLRACNRGDIPGAQRVTRGPVTIWEIPDEAGATWAARYKPYISLMGPRQTSPAGNIVPVTRNSAGEADGE